MEPFQQQMQYSGGGIDKSALTVTQTNNEKCWKTVNSEDWKKRDSLKLQHDIDTGFYK